MLSVHGTFAECVMLETLALSIFNHDSAIASAAARMVSAAEGRPLIEMGSRRTHEQAAVAAARAAYLAGFAGTSNLAAQRRYGVPTLGTSAHAFTLLHTTEDGPDELAAFRSQVAALGVGTTLLVDTYDITAGVANAVAAAGPDLGAVRIDSGDLGVLVRQVRAQLDALGATKTKIVVSSDLDEFAIAALRAEPVDSYGVGTSLVTGSGAPTAGMVYKLVEVDGIPVEKRSSHKESHGGRKQAHRLAKPSGTIVEEVVHPAGEPPAAEGDLVARPLAVPLVRAGEPVADLALAAARERVGAGLHSLPVGRLEALPRRAGHPDPHGSARRAAAPWLTHPPASPACWPPPSPRSAAPSAAARSRWPKPSSAPSTPANTSPCRPAPAPASRWPTWCLPSRRPSKPTSPWWCRRRRSRCSANSSTATCRDWPTR